MRRYAWLAALVVLFLGGLFASKRDIFFSEQVVLTLQQTCDLRQQDCEFSYNGQAFRFSMEPKSILILQPLKITLKPLGMGEGVTKVQVEFEGINMDMGYNRVKLKPTDTGNWQGSGMLPACTAETMHWHIKVLVSGNINGKAETTNFQFRLTTRNS